MVLLTTTPFILSTISALPPSTRSSLRSSSSIPTTVDSPIDHKTLIQISRLSDKKAPTKTTTTTLNKLLRGTRPYQAPAPAKPAPSAEYLALKARLLAEQEAREYAALLHSSSSSTIDPLTGLAVAEEEHDDITPSLVFNIFLSVVLCAGAVFWLTRWWADEAVRVLLSLGVGLVVAVAEVGVYAAYLRKVDLARAKERRKKERKVVLGPYDVDVDPSTGGERRDGRQGDREGQDQLKRVDGLSDKVEGQGQVQIDKEEIWGRGVNGGMRRRVREKWEKENQIQK